MLETGIWLGSICLLWTCRRLEMHMERDASHVDTCRATLIIHVSIYCVNHIWRYLVDASSLIHAGMYIWMYMYLDVERAGGRAHRELLLLDGQSAGTLPPAP